MRMRILNKLIGIDFNTVALLEKAIYFGLFSILYTFCQY